jgi:hypothetical protein
MLAAAGVLAGCLASAPLSRIEGEPRTRSDTTLYAVRVVSVDGRIHFNKPAEPVLLEPGPHTLVLEAEPGRGARGPTQRTYAFKVEPCTHYVFAARRASPMDADWSLVVGSKERVTSCDPQAELAKAAK